MINDDNDGNSSVEDPTETVENQDETTAEMDEDGVVDEPSPEVTPEEEATA